MPEFQLRPHHDHWIGSFQSMASTCEVIIDTHDKELAFKLMQIAQKEALRIEHKFSRYKTDNILWQINNANGSTTKVDKETAYLLDFAARCHELSDGLFDITSGCLRRAWKFDGSDNLPAPEVVTCLLASVGWQKVCWQNQEIQMPADMEIDVGGIGKEYAVDNTLQLLMAKTIVPLLVNFGGDLAVSGPRKNGMPWQVGIETLAADKKANNVLEISAGALATSGDSRRFLLVDNIRYSHILNPFTGWPVRDAPRAVTVAGSNCIQAGMLATFALLQGSQAETFLTNQDVPFWILQ
jgi:thiamine biosynthesis lipoprotein